MKPKTRTVPSLRFSEFEDDWTGAKIGDVFTLISGQHLNPEDYTMTETNTTPYFTGPSDFTNDVKAITKWVLKHGKEALCGDVLFTVKGSGVGTLHLLGLPKVVIGRQLMSIRSNKASSLLLFHYLSTQKHYYKGLAYGNMIPGLSRSDILETKLHLPSLFEQQKIAAFLTAVDDKIQQLSKKKTLLEQYKKCVMQQIFSQEIRFKDENGRDYPSWRIIRLGDIVHRVTAKNTNGSTNVLTISAQQGLINQLKYFNNSVAAKNLSGYIVLKKNDFAYNKSYSNGYPMGAIKRLSQYEEGIVSTLYICFRAKADFDVSFAEQYFAAGRQNKEIEKVAQEGARNHGLLNIGINEFLSIAITLPSLPEQMKIADFLSAIDAKINHVDKQLELTKQYKRSLLQQMFV